MKKYLSEKVSLGSRLKLKRNMRTNEIRVFGLKRMTIVQRRVAWRMMFSFNYYRKNNMSHKNICCNICSLACRQQTRSSSNSGDATMPASTGAEALKLFHVEIYTCLMRKKTYRSTEKMYLTTSQAKDPLQ